MSQATQALLSILLLCCLLDVVHSQVGFCTGVGNADYLGSLGVTPGSCIAVPAIDPLVVSNYANFLAGSVDSSGNAIFPVSICELNPQGYSCAGFNSQTCSCPAAASNGTAGTGRGPRDTTLFLTDGTGGSVPKNQCPYTFTPVTTCTGGCGTATISVPPSTQGAGANCGFYTSNPIPGYETFSASIEATSYEYYTDGTKILQRGNTELATYSFSFPTSLRINSTGVSVLDTNVKAAIVTSYMPLLSTTGGVPTALISLEVVVQYPFALTTNPTITTTGTGYNAVVDSTVPSNPCTPTSTAPCDMIYHFDLTAPATSCVFATQTYTVTVTYSCIAGSGASCPKQGTQTATVIFSFEANNLCPAPQMLQITTTPSTLTMYSDSTLTTTQSSYLVGSTVYAAATNFVASPDGGVTSVPIKAVNLASVAFSLQSNPTILASSTPTLIGTCSTAKCAFSAVIPGSSSLPQPASGSSEIVVVSAVFNIYYMNGAAPTRQTVTFNLPSARQSDTGASSNAQGLLAGEFILGAEEVDEVTPSAASVISILFTTILLTLALLL